jgi:flagellar hook-associated protein 1 FlgK
VGEDTDNAIDLAAFLDRPLSSQFGASIGELYGQLTGGVTQSSAEATSAAEGFRVYETALNGQSLATSGVSLDEEAIKMMSYQRAYQASARYISTINQLLDVLINM